MDSLFNPADLQCLSNLLNDRGNNSSDSEEERSNARDRRKGGKSAPENPKFKVNIRRVGPEDNKDDTQQNIHTNGQGDSAIPSPPKDTKWAIWDDDDEIPTVDTVTDDASQDPRTTPQYDIVYQQSVTSEDIYLQMGGKTPSSVSCEDMVVTIQLPGEQRDKVDCDLTAQHVDIRSVQYRLSLPLPHPILPHLCNATWDQDKYELKVTLRLTREFDYINF